MEELNSQNLIREGASLATREFEEEDLPLVLWLRGDEAICDEFTVDADTAMQMLGIKRSRLTQISGRELRVGKIRIDRYIRPVYRAIDIQNYLQWTRASVSHQKSSQAIELAAKKMDEQRETLLQLLEEFSQNFQEESAQEWRVELKSQARLFLDQFQKLEEMLAKAALNGEQRLQREMRRVDQLQQGANEQLQAMEELGLKLTSLQDVFGHFHEQQLKQEHLLHNLGTQLKSLSEHVERRQTEMFDFCQRAHVQLQETMEELRERKTVSVEEKEMPVRRPRRAIPMALRRRGRAPSS